MDFFLFEKRPQEIFYEIEHVLIHFHWFVYSLLVHLGSFEIRIVEFLYKQENLFDLVWGEMFKDKVLHVFTTFVHDHNQ